VVAATIENLGQSGRMVGVVTHVAELAGRVPVRFEVRKGVAGSVVEKVLS
jgi:exonuclease SbcC